MGRLRFAHFWILDISVGHFVGHLDILLGIWIFFWWAPVLAKSSGIFSHVTPVRGGGSRGPKGGPLLEEMFNHSIWGPFSLVFAELSSD
jgi:hypothetical protein